MRACGDDNSILRLNRSGGSMRQSWQNGEGGDEEEGIEVEQI